MNSNTRKLLVTAAVPLVRYLIEEFASDDMADDVKEAVHDVDSDLDSDDGGHGKIMTILAVVALIVFLLTRKSAKSAD